MEAMIDRVRAILITRHNRLLAIKRIKPEWAPYWVLPGGGVEPGDHDLEAALARQQRIARPSSYFSARWE
jgi:8-oxo-dGTP pyrophosphatase MutT (NUDIX family)